MQSSDPNDPKGLIRDSYRIEGITPADCRSIFLDWVLSLPAETLPETAIPGLLERHGTPGHPMTEVLEEALRTPAVSGRRGGRRGRRLG